MVNASLRSYIIHYDQLGLSRPNHKEKKGENDNIHKYMINKAINDFKTEDFLWVQCLWNYMVDKASLRSYIIHHDQSGLSRPNHKEKGRENDNIHKYVVNVNKAINDII